MAAVNKCQGFGSSPINASSPFAEREMSLSQIDSTYQNGEISHSQAKEMAIYFLAENNAPKEMYLAIALV